MKLKNASRLSMLIEAEGNISVRRPHKRKGYNCLSSPHIQVGIVNTDLGIMNWAKMVMEEELGRELPLREVSNTNGMRTKICYRLVICRFEDVYKILNITRKFMLGIKKQIADRVCSFLNYRKGIVQENNYVNDPGYTKVFDTLVSKVEKIQRTYDQIVPVTTLHSPGPKEGWKTKSELSSNTESLAEMPKPPEME